jgi:hypothetical protein
MLCPIEGRIGVLNMTREEITGKFRIQDPNTKRVFVVHQITEFAIINSYGGKETAVPGKVYHRTDGYDGVNDLGGGLYSIPALGIEEAVLIDEDS